MPRVPDATCHSGVPRQALSDRGRCRTGAFVKVFTRCSCGNVTNVASDLLERLLPLWAQPVDSRDDAVAAFRTVYADPVVVNGAEMPIADLVSRARSLQQAFDGLDMEILDTVEAPGRVVVAFLIRGRHVGPFASPLGTVAPTQRAVEVRTID